MSLYCARSARRSAGNLLQEIFVSQIHVFANFCNNNAAAVTTISNIKTGTFRSTDNPHILIVRVNKSYELQRLTYVAEVGKCN